MPPKHRTDFSITHIVGETMRRRLLFWFVLSLCFGLLACSDSDSDDSTTDGDLDGDQTTDDDDDDDSADGDEEQEEIVFDYASCADPATRLVYPSPLWERAAETPTGVALTPPSTDLAAQLLDSEEPVWLDQLSSLDGFPRMATWVIPLSAAATTVDLSKVEIFTYDGQALTRLEGLLPYSLLDDDGTTLTLKTRKPLPLLAKGSMAILAIYEGALDAGSLALPACDGDSAAQAYVDAAKAVLRANPDASVQLALPTTLSRRAAGHVNLAAKLRATPALQVKSLVAHTDYADYAEQAPDAETEALLAETSYTGLFETPAYQTEDGSLLLDDTETPIAQGSTEPGFVLILPKNGQAPYPMVLFQHGGSRFKTDILQAAKPYAENGLAVLGIDLPYHGDRAEGEGNGSDMDMVDLSNPLKTRDNFLQASADHLTVLTGISVLNAALADETGETETLDAENLFVLGHSMGSLSGTLTTANAGIIKASSLLAGGGPYEQLVREGYFNILVYSLVNNRPIAERETLLAQMQTLLDAGDCVGYPGTLEPADHDPVDVLVWEIKDDPVLIEAGTDWQALVLGAVLAEGADHEVEGMEGQARPISNNYEQQGVSATRVLTQLIRPDVELANLHMQIFWETVVHRQSAACFAARAAGNDCVVDLDPENP